MRRHQCFAPHRPRPNGLFAAVVAIAALTSAYVMDAEIEREAPDLLERDGIEYEHLGPIVEGDAEGPGLRMPLRCSPRL